MFPAEKFLARLDESEKTYLQFLQPIAATGIYDRELVDETCSPVPEDSGRESPTLE